MVESRMSGTIAELLSEWLDTATVETYARAIVTMSEGVCRRWLTQLERPSAQDLAEQLAGLILTGIEGLVQSASSDQSKKFGT